MGNESQTQLFIFCFNYNKIDSLKLTFEIE